MKRTDPHVQRRSAHVLANREQDLGRITAHLHHEYLQVVSHQSLTTAAAVSLTPRREYDFVVAPPRPRPSLWVSAHELIHLDVEPTDGIPTFETLGQSNAPETEPSFGLTAPLFFLPFHLVPVRFAYANLPHCVAVVVYSRQLVERIATGRALKRGEPRRRRRHGSVVSARVRCIARRMRYARRRVAVNHLRTLPASSDEDASCSSLVPLLEQGRDIGHRTDRGMRNVWVNAGNRADFHVHGRALRRDRHSLDRDSVRAVPRTKTCTRAA